MKAKRNQGDVQSKRDAKAQAHADNITTERVQSRHWVLLRGLGRDKRHWGNFSERFRQHFADETVIEIDTLGNGEWSNVASPLSIAQYTDHCREQYEQVCCINSGAINKKLHHSKHNIHLVALSLGGMIALDWSQRFPQEVSTLILLNSSAANLTPWYQRLNSKTLATLLVRVVLKSMLPRTNQGYQPIEYVIEHQVLRATSNQYNNEHSDQQNKLQSRQQSKQPSKQQEKHALVEQWVRFRQVRCTRSVNLCRQLIAASRFQALKLNTLAPLILTSKQDRLVSAVASEQLHHFLGGTLLVHPSAGHDLTLDDASWVIAQIHNHLAMS